VNKRALTRPLTVSARSCAGHIDAPDGNTLDDSRNRFPSADLTVRRPAAGSMQDLPHNAFPVSFANDPASPPISRPACTASHHG
jgi:hypothetical protein